MAEIGQIGFTHLIPRHLPKHSLNSILACFFGVLLLAGVGINLILTLGSGNRIVNNIIVELADNNSREILNEINRFLKTPDTINQTTISAILSDRVDIHKSESMLQLLWDLSERGPDYAISGVYVGDKNGAFTGLEVGGLNKSSEQWEISLANTSTQGLYTDYRFDPDKIIGTQIRQLGPYDPRLRPWYEKAVANVENAIWTDVYLDFDTKAPTITRAKAIVDDGGDLIAVAGVDLFLSRLQLFLSSLSISKNSEVFIADGDGRLLAYNAQAYTGNDIPYTETAEVSNLRFTREIGKMVIDRWQSFGQIDNSFSETIELDGEVGRVHLNPIGRSQDINWTFGIFVPRSDYRNSMSEYALSLAPFVLLSILFALVIMYGFTTLVLRPLAELNQQAKSIATGDFDLTVNIKSNNEVGELASTIDNMRLRLQELFNDLAEQKTHSEIVLNSIADGVISTDQHGIVDYINPAARAKIGCQNSTLIGQPLTSLLDKTEEFSWEVSPSDHLEHFPVSSSQAILVGCDNRSAPVLCKTTSISDGAHGSVVVFSDLSEKLQLKAELMRQASHDSLTNLVNRREFEQRLEHLLTSHTKAKNAHALCFMDLDQFKVINDSCGHVAGDELLKQVSQLFENGIRRGDTVARLGGDEFGLLLRDCNTAQAYEVAQNIISKISAYKFRWADKQFNIGISIGLVGLDSTTPSVSDAMKNADAGCYLAKDAGRNRVHVIQHNDQQRYQRRREIQWVDKINNALEQNLLVLYAQTIKPLSSTNTDKKHIEILVRMKDPEDGILKEPGAFFPPAERYQLVSKIDKWVVETTFAWLEENVTALDSLRMCNINLSGQSLGDPDFLSFLTQQISMHSKFGKNICFEVTETATIENLSSATTLIKALKKWDISFALDDFGRGMSSFEYLKNLPVEFLKIDGLFVKDIVSDPFDFALVKSINEIGHQMGIKTIAESVENRFVKDKLLSIGVDFAQGYDIARPQPLEEVLAC